MSLGKKLFVGILSLFCASVVVQQFVTMAANRRGFQTVMSGFEQSLATMQQETAANLNELSVQSARDLMAEIKIGIGEALQPGEGKRFLHIAEKQKQLSELREFSFFGPDGRVELSSDAASEGRAIDPEVWSEGERTKELVIRDRGDALELYEPLFAGVDMVRFRPNWRVGQYYGMIYVKLAKDRINGVLAAEQTIIAQSLADGKATHARAEKRSTWFSLGMVVAGALSMAVVLLLVIRFQVHKPVHRAASRMLAASAQLDHSSNLVAEVSGAVAEDAGQQASSLQESAAALEEMAAQTRQTAVDAAQVNTISTEVHDSTQAGQAAMARMSETIGSVKSAADDTARIVKTIDEIAFQTNLLALNAAVEAARAGDAGKGFAVVAAEVRNLAQRSAEAARQTAALIEESVQRSEQGVTVCAQVVATLDKVVAGVTQVSTLINNVAAATDQQARSVDEVNRAVSQMDQLTQSNAARSEESAAAATDLTEQSHVVREVACELLRLVDGNGANAEVSESAIESAIEPATASTIRPRPSLAVAETEVYEEELAEV
ncbi:MAG TPA: methyl-accepting chemotaxis protein [Candidatus Krumholzibacteria bacterium]|nr:methyl-accepting chemotaxis protein [Candidatus Krumholzibacteria bacterium]HPD70330.1 methyl-accepting chemotaxis protein [Candidatus Krumholzibacteria bacterium]HRY39970.1 methyl-accepting chemotaxis protein [Candidatus Krumholzibacteria bacterium]